MEEVIFETKQGRGPHYGRFGEDGAGHLLTLILRSIELGGGVGVYGVRGYLDEAVDVIFRYCVSDAFGSCDVDVVEAEVFRGPVAADEVVDYVAVPDALFNRGGVAEVHFEEDDAAEVAGDFEVAFGHFFAVGDYYCVARACESVYDVPAQEACCAEDGCSVAAKGGATAGYS